MILKELKKGDRFTFDGDSEIWEKLEGNYDLQRRLKKDDRTLCIRPNQGVTETCIAYPNECIVKKVGRTAT